MLGINWGHGKKVNSAVINKQSHIPSLYSLPKDHKPNMSQISIRNQRNGHCPNTYVTNILIMQVTMKVISTNVSKLSRNLWNDNVMKES